MKSPGTATPSRLVRTSSPRKSPKNCRHLPSGSRLRPTSTWSSAWPVSRSVVSASSIWVWLSPALRSSPSRIRSCSIARSLLGAGGARPGRRLGLRCLAVGPVVVRRLVLALAVDVVDRRAGVLERARLCRLAAGPLAVDEAQPPRADVAVGLHLLLQTDLPQVVEVVLVEDRRRHEEIEVGLGAGVVARAEE